MCHVLVPVGPEPWEQLGLCVGLKVCQEAAAKLSLRAALSPECLARTAGSTSRFTPMGVGRRPQVLISWASHTQLPQGDDPVAEEEAAASSVT